MLCEVDDPVCEHAAALAAERDDGNSDRSCLGGCGVHSRGSSGDHHVRRRLVSRFEFASFCGTLVLRTSESKGH